MPCYHPIRAWRSRTPGVTGKIPLTFDRRKSNGQEQTITCGQCRGCRLEQSRQWAIRCVHESKMHEHNCFITLTYDEANLPHGGTLVKEHYRLFMRRLRKKIKPQKVRFYMCGEYGETNHRPHYHALLFGYEFPDKELLQETARGDRIYTSEILSELWGKGMCSIGAMTFETAAYTARYVMKKITGKDAPDHYERTDPITGELYSITPEYNNMSRAPGIGTTYYEKWKSDMYPGDRVVIRGKQMQPPRAYDKYQEIENPEIYEKIKKERQRKLKKHEHNNTDERLRTREICAQRKGEQLQRKL